MSMNLPFPPLGLAAAQSYRGEHGHLDVPTDHVAPVGYEPGTSIITKHDPADDYLASTAAV
jgi:hypothetical protein